MNLIFTYVDRNKNEEILDFGVNTETGKVFSVPQERLDCIRQGLIFLEPGMYLEKFEPNEQLFN